MTDTAPIGAEAPKLAPFDGKRVASTAVSITNAGDGLSKAMKADPVELHHGDTVHVVLECEVSKVRFDPITDADALQRVHILRAGTATFVDGALVDDVLAQQRKRIEEAAGVKSLDFDGAADPDEPDDPGDEPEDG